MRQGVEAKKHLLQNPGDGPARQSEGTLGRFALLLLM
jgi:hypothetical protein